MVNRSLLSGRFTCNTPGKPEIKTSRKDQPKCGKSCQKHPKTNQYFRFNNCILVRYSCSWKQKEPFLFDLRKLSTWLKYVGIWLHFTHGTASQFNFLLLPIHNTVFTGSMLETMVSLSKFFWLSTPTTHTTLRWTVGRHNPFGKVSVREPNAQEPSWGPNIGWCCRPSLEGDSTTALSVYHCHWQAYGLKTERVFFRSLLGVGVMG